jgi:hypothetical protein
MINLVNKKINTSKKKIACLTLDFEDDYGDRIGKSKIIENHSNKIIQFSDYLKKENIPLSLFIVAQMLERNLETIDLVKDLGSDFHSHSYSHITKYADSHYQIKKSKEIINKYLGVTPLGYRAPQGVIKEEDLDILVKSNYKFSSSIFPSYRFKKFNNLKLPIMPFNWKNGLIEIPLAVIPHIRLIYSLSYIKLLGLEFYKFLTSILKLSNIVIIDTHLHDIIYSEESFEKLKGVPRLAWSIRKKIGQDYLKGIITTLKKDGYTFISITELYNILKSETK